MGFQPGLHIKKREGKERMEEKEGEKERRGEREGGKRRERKKRRCFLSSVFFKYAKISGNKRSDALIFLPIC